MSYDASRQEVERREGIGYRQGDSVAVAKWEGHHPMGHLVHLLDPTPATYNQENKKTWILTNGINCGVAQCVDKALQQQAHEQAYERLGYFVRGNPSTENKPLCIGIASWGNIVNAEKLVQEDNAKVQYDSTQAAEEGESVPLSPNHTHFLLVDDGQQGDGGDLKLRPRMEKALVEAKIPLVMLMLGGDEVDVNYVCNSAKEDIPIVLCTNTGGGAKVLSRIISGKAEQVKHDVKTDQHLNELVQKLALDNLEDMSVLTTDDYTKIDGNTSGVYTREFTKVKARHITKFEKLVEKKESILQRNSTKYLTRILQPLTGKTRHHVKDSRDFASFVSTVTLKDTEMLVSFDVESLFTSIPVNEAIGITMDRLKDDPT
ncbi:transient receptor potential cation channel subfamily M member 2-like [Amphiura filiformis]|uniref:transient receptor potential cation channel subfamily M member 2-like n=1 Tax=Amphiura filiformis TaxID=82378 RepID=UPI003B20F877